MLFLVKDLKGVKNLGFRGVQTVITGILQPITTKLFSLTRSYSFNDRKCFNVTGGRGQQSQICHKISRYTGRWVGRLTKLECFINVVFHLGSSGGSTNFLMSHKISQSHRPESGLRRQCPVLE